ncbi:hypothetical protein QP222_05950 [Corynebacterium pyruviciproducens]|uniref:hypothetical protein n=1 Tax=Corynebacterium pyruviciproducens TaxID=598660 RepID=UPI00254B8311|nr:hypothetical protein [Corynebacterium pyruviciproducens]MDK6565947.1 hypothetical protein [Corynebacterium pyruviciproducens]
MIEEALLTRARDRDREALVRTRGRQVFVITSFDVLACRTSPVDVTQLTTTVSSLLDAPPPAPRPPTQRDCGPVPSRRNQASSFLVWSPPAMPSTSQRLSATTSVD